MKFISCCTFTIATIVTVSISLIALFATSDTDKILLPYYTYDEKKAFDGKVIWVTGASSGIGASLACDLTAAGAQVIISARRIQLLEEVSEKCSKFGKIPFILPLDVTDIDRNADNFAMIIQKFGRLDTLVLNPGRSQRALALDTTLNATKELFDLNFFSYVSLAKIVVPSMISNGGGHVVVVSSIAGKFGTPVSSTYSATKFALHGYFDAFRAENKYLGITVSLMCLGPVVSEILDHVIKEESTPVEAEPSRMETSRCTGLMVKGMFHKVEEMWISHQPLLSLTFVAEYMPWLSRQLFTNIVGPSRAKMLKTGGSMYSLSANLGLKDEN